ncbi:HTH-type transcriptional repressor YtrA [bioreactor metagenome]|uniref:HTH-type transcriptional repressor YtrA n=1 Tax=bioreactor metagenome TaxID=1076179 RepID=A0A644Z8Z4_9ZZZZ
MDIIIRSSGGPIYEQIVTQVRQAVLRGELKAGDPLPSMRALASDLRVSVITTKRAYEELEREGIVESMVGRGSFITGRDPGHLRDEGLRQVRAAAENAVDTARRYGIEETVMLEIVREIYGGMDNE